MNKVRFTREEVLAYLELLVISEEADEYELELYQDYLWGFKHKLNIQIDTYKNLLKKMRKVYYKGV